MPHRGRRRRAGGEARSGAGRAHPGPDPRRQRRRERDPRRGPHGNRPRDRPRIGQGQRPARAGDQGGRAGRAGRRRSTRARRERHRAPPDPRPRGHPRPLHGREPLDPHRHQLPHAPGGRARRPPARAQGGRPQAQLHAPDRLGDRPGRARHAGDGQLVRRAGRQAAARGARHDQPRAGGRRRAQGRHALARRAGPEGRERAELPGLRRALRRAGRGRARQHAAARRLLGRQHQPHQPGRHRNDRQRAAG